MWGQGRNCGAGLGFAGRVVWIWATMVCLGTSMPARGAQVGADNDLRTSVEELKTLTIDDLLDIQIVSVSKKQEPYTRAAAAIYVLSGEDIRRSAVTSIPEALRLVPGIQVVQLGTMRWAITARGFNGLFANKLLVMIDGRTIYSSLFSGVFWGEHDIALENIERIEVVRGPGGAMWGANAVNGVINIITARPDEQRGGLLSVGAGDVDLRRRVFVSHDARGGARSDYRVYGHYVNRGPIDDALPGDLDEERNDARVGSRGDWELTGGGNLTLQGELFEIHEDISQDEIVATPTLTQRSNFETETSGANLRTRWQRTDDTGLGWIVQGYIDRVDREIGVTADDTRTYAVDFQQSLVAGKQSALTWGGSYRHVKDRIVDNSLTVIPTDRDWTLDLWSAFAQNEWSLHEHRVRLVAGAKLEHNSLTGIEVQPSFRAGWYPSERSTFWWALSRAVRTPSRETDDLRVNAAVVPMIPLPLLISSIGNPNLVAESVVSAEFGYRARLAHAVSLDLALYRNFYDDLLSFEFAAPVPDGGVLPPHLLAAISWSNDGEADTHGLELALDWAPTDSWKLRTGYTYHAADIAVPNTFLDEGRDPRHHGFVRSSWNPGARLELDAAVRFVDDVSIDNQLTAADIDSYITLDLRLGFRPGETFEFELIGRNLVDHDGVEFEDYFFGATTAEIGPSLYVAGTWRF